MSYLKFKWVLVFLLIFTLTSCEVIPKKIAYGQNHCAFCDMTVVDKTHASEYVTKKGKSYIFDSVECMIQKLNKDNNEKNLTFILVSDFSDPGNLIKAQTATYLIGSKIKSPMGANLSAFSNKQKTVVAQQEFGGEIYNWNQIKSKFKK